MLRLGTDQEFTALRDLLARANYLEPEFCSRFGIASLEQFEEEFDRAQIEDFEKDAHGVLIQLFVEGQYVQEALARQRFGDEALEAMASLGMLERNPRDADEIAATVALYPTADVWIVSDRWNHPDRGVYKPEADVVYPSIVANAQRFLRFMPQVGCERMLDLCSGTAFAALHGAKLWASQAWAIDITERSTLFGEFNRRLNGLANVTVQQGDLYAPAAGQTFDRIVAHPPYVPVLRSKWVYQDGGEDGEQILRRCVQGVPDHLAPGGLFYLLAMTSDREDATYEQRVRQWLGENEGEFDVAVFVVRSLDPEEFAVRAVLNNESPQSDFRELRDLFREIGIQQMIYAVLMIQRRAEPRQAFTVRRQMSASSTVSEMLATLRWETRLRQPDGFSSLLSSRPRPNPETELRTAYKLVPEGWEIGEYSLRVSHPFSMEARTDQWAPYLVAHCDGEKTVTECLTALEQEGVVPEGTSPEEFARAIAVLVSGGFLLMQD